jgi:ubiquinone/menaquinone biosynthesis C-methylase UbiE
MSQSSTSNWNTFARVNASQRWRHPSAAMGRDLTAAIVAEAQVREGMHVLDVACGTGEPAISIATQLHGSGAVVGSDISTDPLKVAEQRARERGLTNIDFVPADVHQLPFPSQSFDRVTCRLGVMFFADLPRALLQIHRVLKPGGRASLLAWGPIEQPYFDVTLGTILRALPEVVLPASGAAMFKFAQPDTLAKALRQTGFTHVEERLVDVPWNWPGTPEEMWEYFQEVTIPFKPLFETIPAERRDDIHTQVVAAITRHYNGQAVRFDANIVMVSALK